uniref:Uncharacterized protein n=1 Tax=Anguilla anguilla TaxID=7936 RepID=A0A0E9PWG4_ANGAN
MGFKHNSNENFGISLNINMHFMIFLTVILELQEFWEKITS